MKKKNRHKDLLFVLWCLSTVTIFILFLIYWISVNKLIILILITATLYQLLKRYARSYLILFFLLAIGINIFYGLITLL